MGPPSPAVLVHCIHCGQEYDSDLIERRPEPGADGHLEGFWCCPVADCDGIGFCFDIWPVDPDWTNEHGEKVLHFIDDNDDGFGDDTPFGTDEMPGPPPDRSGPPPFSDHDIPF